MGVALFVYGTLRDNAVVRRVTGRVFVSAAAVLSGYRRVEPTGHYAYILPDAAGRVHGRLLRDVDPDALRALDAYEDEDRLYRRLTVHVRVEGHDEAAQTYVALPAVQR